MDWAEQSALHRFYFDSCLRFSYLRHRPILLEVYCRGRTGAARLWCLDDGLGNRSAFGLLAMAIQQRR